MEAIVDLDASVRFDIFTTIPPWFFRDTLSGGFDYHALLTDVGLVQETPLQVDLRETILRLDRLLPFSPSLIEGLVSMVAGQGCSMILCDIAPLGILVAREAGIPSVLIENFTWDWIYQDYVREEPAMERHIPYLRDCFDLAGFHIQTEPICSRAEVDLTTFPMARRIRRSAGEVRERLGIPPGVKVALITMGGIPSQYHFLEKLSRRNKIRFIVSGGSEKAQVHGNVILLPPCSGHYHPDLVNAADAVVGKAGYSTLAEVYAAGVPFGYVARERFRESGVLVSFIQTHMSGLPVAEGQFQSGTWLHRLDDLLSLPRAFPGNLRGAGQAARFILEKADLSPRRR